MKSKRILFFLIAFVLLFQACKDNPTPRPKGYFRITLSEPSYQNIPDSFPYTFKYSNQAQINTEHINKKKTPFWMNLKYNQFNAAIHISYYAIHNNLQLLLNETHKLAYKHSIKANAIDEKILLFPEKKVYGTFFIIEGNTANNLQFFLTDSVKNYFRAALYFNSEPNIDSIKPVLNYLKKDMEKMIETFEWK